MITIGVDESGWGAVAGPFTVAAVALEDTEEAALVDAGVKDSKKLTDEKRAALMDNILVSARAVDFVSVDVTRIKDKGPAVCHHEAVKAVILGTMQKLREANVDVDNEKVVIIIDGKPIGGSALMFSGIKPAWKPKADSTFTAVAAASIVAKQLRTDLMEEMHDSHPEYEWKSNQGYPTPDHKKLIEEHGMCEQHRDVKLAPTPKPKSEEPMKTETAPKKTTKKAAPKKAVPKKAAKGTATKASAKKAVTKAATKAATPVKSDRYSREPGPMMMRLGEKIDEVNKFAAHAVERATIHADKAAEKKTKKAIDLLEKAKAALS